MISLWQHYNDSYAQYEHSFPPAFPWNHEGAEDVPRYLKGEDGYWLVILLPMSGRSCASTPAFCS